MRTSALELILAIPLAAAAPGVDDGRDYAPSECPVAGNVESGIYHIAGGGGYERMLRGGKLDPLRVACFATEEEAKAAGYRPARTPR